MPAATTPLSPPRRPPLPPALRFTPPDRVDLRTAWARERTLATRPGAPHGGPGWSCAERHGWLLDDGLDLLLEPALGGNAQPGFYPFAALDERSAAGLLARLPQEELASQRQNLGPTLGTVLRAVVRHPGRVRAQGYVIGPLRCDERISVTAVLVRTDRALRLDRRHGAGCECRDAVGLLADLGVDDMHAPPDEVTPWWGFGYADHPDDDDTWYRLWWD